MRGSLQQINILYYLGYTHHTHHIKCQSDNMDICDIGIIIIQRITMI